MTTSEDRMIEARGATRRIDVVGLRTGSFKGPLAVLVVVLSACTGGAPRQVGGPGAARSVGPPTGTAGRSSAPGPEAERIGPVAGAYYALVDRAGPRRTTLTVDVVQFFTGAAAARACVQDGVPDQHGALCHAYYIRDRSPRRQTLPLRPGATVTGGCTGPRTATSGPVLPGRSRLVRLTIAGGAVTRIDGTCLP